MDFQDNGCLPVGIHTMTFDEFTAAFGYNDHRKKLISGLKRGIDDLIICGCSTLYVDGSFTTTKSHPKDFDACWDEIGVSLLTLKIDYPILWDFTNERKRQKDYYFGEFFPMRVKATPADIFKVFFQKDKDGNPKGIVQLILK
jgi:hypothetical protein